jgi:hypothetical protein
MKRLKKIMVIFITFVSLLFVGISCESNVPKPDCEIYHTGNIKVVNKASINLWVDVADNVKYENSPVRLWPMTSTDYAMPVGKVYIFAASDVNFNLGIWKQASGDYHATECGTFTFTWTGGKGISIDIEKDG